MTNTDLVVLAVITAVVGLAVFKMVRDKKKGASGCSCSGCPVAGQCDSPVKK
ncbi:MAG: FeoB-associated Cys-rich membrane protein [Spirochaetales bacterium]|nr:FeoB-associated Cys-rich membrane protein [Spirochaetales bacterium]